MANGEVYYNYGMQPFPSEEAPGISVFYKDDAGEVFHTYSTYGRGVEVMMGTYNLLDLTPKGRDERRRGLHDGVGAPPRPLRAGTAAKPAPAQPPFSLSFRAWWKVDGHLVSPIPPAEAAQRPGEDVADRQPGKDAPERVKWTVRTGVECMPFGPELAVGTRAARSPWTTLPTRPK